MQPYLFPYRGYIDLIASVDKFVLYDDAKYMKGKFINRNYFPELFTFRLKKHSDYAKINELSFFDVGEDKKIFKRKFPNLSQKALGYVEMLSHGYSLNHNIFRTLKKICEDLGISTPFHFASEYPHGKFVQGVLDIVRALGGDTYVNLPGGRSLYNQEQFGEIKLDFIETIPGPSILCEL